VKEEGAGSLLSRKPLKKIKRLKETSVISSIHDPAFNEVWPAGDNRESITLTFLPAGP
jgi:hypothetical protein